MIGLLLNAGGIVAIGANEGSQGDASDFRQLIVRESCRWVIRLVPETIALLQPVELLAYDAGKCGANDAVVFNGSFG